METAPKELYELALAEIERAEIVSGRPPKEVAAIYIAHILNQRDKLVDTIESGYIDPKTGLLTDRAFREHADEVLIGIKEGRRRQDYCNSALLIVFDLIDFKDINDRFGHAAGDKRLAAAGKFIRETIRSDSGDLPGRIGGDEFAALILYDRFRIDHEAILEELETRIGNAVLENGMPPLRWNHAFFNGHENIEELLARGDVKGPPKEQGLVREHTQSLAKRQAAYAKACRLSLPR